MNVKRVIGLASILVLVLLACGSDRSGFEDGRGGPTAGAPAADAGAFGTSDATSDGPARPPVVGWLKGKVVAPEGTVPVSQAMVYLTTKAPDAIPDKAYCDTCVHLTPYEPYAYTKADGTFELGAYATGKQLLVVQKGQFRRVREVDVVAGDQNVAAELTRLPGKTNPQSGDTIPKIAMVVGGYDRIDVSLKKLGVEEFYRYGDAPFDFGGPPPGIKTGKSGNALMGDASEMGAHHIVLLPCAAMGASRDDNSGRWTCGAPSNAQKNAFKGYVEGGGKLYVTDFAYEAVRQTWPGLITFYDDTMQPLVDPTKGIGTACRGGAEDTAGTAKDKGLADWMTAIGHSSIDLHASWSRMQKVDPQPGVDAQGKPVTITPKVWMTSQVAGKELPATVSFEQKCGRVLFSTYHAEGDIGSQLLAQEKALLYILLEVGVCVGDLPPPPPPK